MTRIYFRTDANSDIATGHIMRCLSIARACAQISLQQKKRVQISFLVSDNQSRALLSERFETAEEFAIHCLNSDYRYMEAEVHSLLAYINDNTDDNIALSDNSALAKPWLFIDSYFATPAYFRMLSADCRIAYLDDLRSFHCPVDLLINYDTDQDCPCYAKAAHKLLGMQYTPLRTQFQSPVYHVRPKASHVLLSTGGTDPYGIAEYLLRTIYQFPSIPDKEYAKNDGGFWNLQDISLLQSLQYHIVTSKANTRYDNLTALALENPHIHIHDNVSHMASLMASCDLALSAGGTTLAELCAVGVPTISCLMADNQRTAVENFSSKGIIPCAGDIRPVQTDGNGRQSFDHAASDTSGIQLPSSVIEAVLKFMTYMSQNSSAREKSSHAMRAFLDGCGAQRIVSALLTL